jgi:hypothetical protein
VPIWATAPVGTFLKMMRSEVCLVALLLAVGLAGVGASAGPRSAPAFSADIVTRDGGGATIGKVAKLYVADDQVRIETPDLPDGYLLIDRIPRVTFFVRPAQRVFMDAKQSSRLTRIFVPVDPKDPCPQWLAAALNAGLSGEGWRCERVDSASSDGLDNGEYQVVSAGRESHLWVDRDLEFPVKEQAADGATIMLENIRREAQPEDLFLIPADFRKFDPQALIDRIKQSDVWVKPPK